MKGNVKEKVDGECEPQSLDNNLSEEDLHNLSELKDLLNIGVISQAQYDEQVLKIKSAKACILNSKKF